MYLSVSPFNVEYSSYVAIIMCLSILTRVSLVNSYVIVIITNLVGVLIIGNLHFSSTDFENPKVVNKMFGMFQGTASIAGSAQQVQSVIH